ncbi:MAG: hypothetical protein ACPGGL_09225, partial [Phycisphaerales bacterium]
MRQFIFAVLTLVQSASYAGPTGNQLSMIFEFNGQDEVHLFLDANNCNLGDEIIEVAGVQLSYSGFQILNATSKVLEDIFITDTVYFQLSFDGNIVAVSSEDPTLIATWQVNGFDLENVVIDSPLISSPSGTEIGTCEIIIREVVGCTDTDADGTCDENDLCPLDPEKSEPGNCGCGVPETDVFGDLDCDGDYDIDDIRLGMTTFGIEE